MPQRYFILPWENSINPHCITIATASGPGNASMAESTPLDTGRSNSIHKQTEVDVENKDREEFARPTALEKHAAKAITHLERKVNNGDPKHKAKKDRVIAMVKDAFTKFRNRNAKSTSEPLETKEVVHRRSTY